MRWRCIHDHGRLPLPLAGEGWGGGVSAIENPQEERALSRPLPQAGEVKNSSALVLNRNVHVLDLQLTHRLEHGPGDIRIDLDLEVIHALQRLMVLFPE